MNGFAKYQRFYERAPSLVVEWHDTETDAVGWLAIDSLRGGAAGGGTRMRADATREEAVFLAKTMGVKFRVCGPEIGGGKSVIRFDPSKHPGAKKGVLERWYRHIGPYLKLCYGTGGDVNVDEVSEATEITRRVLGIGHPQEGICRGHNWADGEMVEEKVRRLHAGCEAKIRLPDLPGPRDGAWMIADVVTGYGVCRAVEAYYRHRGETVNGKRVIVEGLGAVGAFAAYYLEMLGAVLVSASTYDRKTKTVRVIRDEKGLDARSVICSREGTTLPKPGRGNRHITASRSGDEVFEVDADILVPAATSHTLTAARIKKIARSGVKVLSCGANNPFAYKASSKTLSAWVRDMLVLQREADKKFAVIPDFVANCGMARTFAYLMTAGAVTNEAEILADTGAMIDGAMERLMTGHTKRHGLLERGYSVFIPD
ncbi:MAG: Glu/Leu/Phe/Val dehydrogenase [Phycisphaeraceae bacterium]|nr:Glu/Leu/Phe/Val dehydrogenase [Phycisphaeraceae bacterium]